MHANIPVFVFVQWKIHECQNDRMYGNFFLFYSFSKKKNVEWQENPKNFACF